MNKVLFKVHSTLALIFFLPILVICLTGSVLVFKYELDRALTPQRVSVEPDGNRQSLDTLITTVRNIYPEREIVGWALFQDAARADLAYTIAHGNEEWNYLIIDQYRNRVIQPPAALDSYLTDWLLALHAELLMGHTGFWITSVMAIVLCVMGVSGFLLYRKFWKSLFLLRWRGRLVVYFSDLHKTVGIISSPVLLVLGITGGYWTISGVWHEMEEHAAGEQHHIVSGPLYNHALSVQQMLEDAERNGMTATYVSLPWEPDRSIGIYGDVQSGNPLHSEYASMQSFDSQTGVPKAFSDIRQADATVQVLDSFRNLHYGIFGGLLTRLIWCVIGAMPLLLSITGGYLWWRRRDARRAKAARLRAALV